MKEHLQQVSAFILIISFLSGCAFNGPTPDDNRANTPSGLGSEFTDTPPQPDATQGMMPTLAIPVTSNTGFPPTATLTTEETSAKLTQVPEGLRSQCLEVMDSIPGDANLSGKLVFTDVWSTYVYDLDTGMRTDFLEVQDYYRKSFFASPDRRMLAYVLSMSVSPYREWIIVEGNDGSRMAKVEIPAGVMHLNGWLDSERLWLTKDRDPIPPDKVIPVSSVVILNPFNGESEELLPDYPGLEPLETFVRYHFGNTSVSYDSSLAYAVYSQSGEPDTFIVLWNRVNNEAVAKLPYSSLSRTPLLWSPDGQWVLVSITPYGNPHTMNPMLDEWFRIRINGKIEQLTHFAQAFENVIIFSNPAYRQMEDM